MQTQLVSSQDAKERFVSALKDAVRSFPCQGWSTLSNVDVGGCSPSDLVVTINTTPFEGVLLGCVQVRMIESQSTDEFRFAVTFKLPSINRQHQELRYSSPKEFVGVFFTHHVLSITKLNESEHFHLSKLKHTDSKFRFLVVWVLTYHSAATKSSVSDIGVPYQKLSE
jgi:hypothetical protein